MMILNLDELYEKAAKVVNKDNYDEFKRIVEDFKNKLEFDYNLRNRRNVVIERIDKAVFFGDIHGDLDTLYRLSKNINMDKLLRENWHMIFLGDYIDRGYNQLETIVFIAMLKINFPSRVLTLRGNHEPYKYLVPYPHDYPEKLASAFGSIEGAELYDLSRELFDLMPLLLLVPGKLLAVHGGPPISRIIKYNSIEDILAIEGDNEAIEDILWSDPVEDQDVDYMLSYRGAGKLWGPSITMQTLEKLNVKIIVRGHEPVNGYRFSHGGKVLTLFSMKGYYGNMLASCLLINLDEVEDLKAIERGIVSL